MTFPALLARAALDGLLVGLAMSAVVAVSGWINPVLWLNDYPPAVRAAYLDAHGPPDASLRGPRWTVAVLLLAVLLGGPLWAMLRAGAGAGGFTFLQAAAYVFAVLVVVNLWDLLVLDGLIVCVWTPRRIVLPGTEGHPGYKDFGYHVRAFGRGLVLAAAIALLYAALYVLLT